MDTAFKVNIPLRVRFADVDAMGHVNNAKFLTYFEEARVFYLKQVEAWDFTKPGWSGQESLIVASIKIDFVTPAYVGEDLVIGIKVSRVGNTSFDFEYQITSKQGARLVAKGLSTQVYFNYKDSKSLQISQAIKEDLAKIEAREF